jgi:membrane protease YdiL (CAAX protease family)
VARWAAFLGLTAVVITLFLVLARLSQAAVGDDAPLSQPSSPSSGPAGPEPHADPDLQPARNSLNAEPDVDSATAEQDGDVGTADGTSAAASATRHPSSTGISTGALLANVALTQGLFGALVAAGAWYFEIPPPALGLGGGPWVDGLPALALGLGFGLALWVGNEAAAALADVAGAAYDEELRRMLAPDRFGGWALLFGGVLPIIAVVEEFLFRAAFIGAAAVGLGTSPWALAVVSSGAFALGHGAQGRIGVVVTGALGFALAAGFVLTGSLLVVVVAHYAVNTLEFLAHEAVGFD